MPIRAENRALLARAHGPRPALVHIVATPRADAAIAATLQTLATVQFEQDPLLDAIDSFRFSLTGSAIKREGRILEEAVKDAIDATPHLRLMPAHRRAPRIPDVIFEHIPTTAAIGIELKRGSQHDSGNQRQFRDDLRTMPALLREHLPPLFTFHEVRFHIVFVSGKPRIQHGLKLDDLKGLYGLNARPAILTARQRYSAGLKDILRQRGL